MNYTQLREAVESAVENSFADDDFATMTKMAEQKIYNSVQLAILRKNVAGTTQTGIKYILTPDDFLSIYSLAVVDGSGNYSYLLNKDVNFIRECYPNPSDTGLPRFYAIFGPDSQDNQELTLIVAPTPDNNYAIELHYFFMPESIVTANTSWVGDNFDSVLFNAVMVEAARWLKLEQDMVQLYEKEYVKSLTLLKNMGDGKQRQDAYRSGQLRTQVV